MIICICNNLNDSKIKEAFADGSANCKEVMAYHGCEFQCKKCVPAIHDIKKSLLKKN